MNKRMKYLKRIICLALVTILSAEPSMSDYKKITYAGNMSLSGISYTDIILNDEVVDTDSADSDNKSDLKYISDLRLYQANKRSVADIEKAAANDGYTLYKEGTTAIDLDEYTGEDAVYIAYKTTENEEDAIRGIKALEMGRGYEWFDYQKIAEGQMEKLEIVASDVSVAISEYKKNLKAGSKQAKIAKDYLNLMYFTEDKKSSWTSILGLGSSSTTHKIYLGDYFEGTSGSEKVNLQTLKKFAIQMNGGSLSAMFSQLALACSDTEEKNWVERIPETECYQTTEVTSSKASYWDRLYYTYSVELLPKIQEFANGYKKAELRKSDDGKVKLVDIEVENDEELASDNATEVMEAGNEDEAGDIFYEVAYGMLNQYSIGDEKAGDYFIELADKTYKERTDYRKLYPLVEALTDGQYVGMKYVGLAQMALYLIDSDEFFEDLENRKKDVIETIKTATGGEEKLYIYAGVNTEFYTRQVALTSDAYRESNASNVYLDITREGEFYDNINLAFMGIGLACSVSAVITGCVTIGLLIAGSSLTVWAACCSIVGSGVLLTVAGIAGCAAVIVGWAALAALIITGIVYFCKWLYDQFKDPEKGDYTEMPSEIYDVSQVYVDNRKKMEYVKYSPVTNETGAVQDLNAFEGKRWVCLYYTKNNHYGSPLCLNSNGNVFKRTLNSINAPEGYESVSAFGGKTATDLNTYTKVKSSRELYLHYVTEDLVNGTIYVEEAAESTEDIEEEENVNKGTKNKLTKKEKYLYGLVISHASTVTEAKAFINKKPGYTVYNKNLTSGNGYTYLGYASTTVKKDAITDIRIVPNFNGDSASLGGASYGSAGTLPDGSALVFTRYASAGTPIIDTFKTSTKRLALSDAFEPINLICGGEAYNLTGNRKNPLYLYFKPSVSYTSGEQYISGLQFVSGRKGESTRTRAALGKELGLTPFNVNFAPYSLYDSSDKYYYSASIRSGHGTSHVTTSRTLTYGAYELYLYTSYTYNPYRAISDVMAYTGTTKTGIVQQAISNSLGAYAAVENTMISDKACFEGRLTDKDVLRVKPVKTEVVKTLSSRTYIDPTCGSLNDYRKKKTTYKLEKNITWTDSYYRPQALYVLGHIPGRAPLKKDDIVVTKDSTPIDGMHSVQRFTDPYNENPINLAYIDPKLTSDGAYIFIRGEAKKAGKYISAIDVSTYKRPTDTEKHKYSDDELKEYDKMADDICRMTLISKIDAEVLNYNITVNQTSAWYSNSAVVSGAASYIGVSRTDDPNYAITGLLMYYSSTMPSIKIKVDGIEYHRVGDKFGNYYLYYTKSPGANPGVPIENITFDNIPIIKGNATAIGITANDKGEVIYMDKFTGQNGYLHMSFDEGETVISDLKIFTGEMSEVLVKLMSEGYNYMITESLNAHAGGTNVYLAYKNCSAEAAELSEDDFDDEDFDDEDFEFDDDDWDMDDEDWEDFDIDFDIVIFDDNVVRDIICTVGKTPEKTITVNGAEYNLVSDVSLNAGVSGGTSLYLYYTLDEEIIVGTNRYKLPALESLALCSGDAVPSTKGETSKFGAWEMLLDDEGKEVNVNEGIIAKKDDDKYVKDCRLFLFAKRHNGNIKQGAEIIRGVVSEKAGVGDLYISE